MNLQLHRRAKVATGEEERTFDRAKQRGNHHMLFAIDFTVLK